MGVAVMSFIFSDGLSITSHQDYARLRFNMVTFAAPAKETRLPLATSRRRVFSRFFAGFGAPTFTEWLVWISSNLGRDIEGKK